MVSRNSGTRSPRTRAVGTLIAGLRVYVYVIGMSILRFGTCSWKFPSWAGLVYSQADGIDYLAEYAQTYRSVEIDQWFWSLFAPDKISLPQTETVAGYLASVDEDSDSR